MSSILKLAGQAVSKELIERLERIGYRMDFRLKEGMLSSLFEIRMEGKRVGVDLILDEEVTPVMFAERVVHSARGMLNKLPAHQEIEYLETLVKAAEMQIHNGPGFNDGYYDAIKERALIRLQEQRQKR